MTARSEDGWSRTAGGGDEPRRGLFIDLDGTLADSLSVMRLVYGRFLGHFGKSASDDEFERLNGPPLAEVVADLSRTHSITRPAASLLEIYWGFIDDAYRDVRPRAGAADLLRTARSRGARVGVVTSSATGLTRRWLQGVGLEELVDVIVGGDAVRRGKPDPEPYAHAMERTGCAAADSLAVEDSVTGARSAVAAGLPTVLLSEPGVRAVPSVTFADGLSAVEALIRERWPVVGGGR